ncbi:MAG: Methionine aminopeptidase [Candidatus Bathyarchaeota archaeon BA1]|nr:MAG: Methionine aminopeptidase [Candidatus Bathyarchaeota archaeon BA1]
MAIPEEVLQKYQRAGKIAAEVREEVRMIVHEGMPILDLCEKTESLIREKGGKPAFPCNVSVDEVTAHYTSPPQDRRAIPENAIVKIDLGAHVDGFIADTAVTVCFNPEYDSLVHTAEEALKRAIEILRPGLFVARFGSIIQKTIEAHGCKPISNLTGHKIERYLVHAGKSLPNVSHISTTRVEEGEVYGVEPFVTLANAVGRVESGQEAHIFRFLKQKSLRDPHARRLLDHIKANFRTLPFTERWLGGVVPPGHYRAAFSELLSSRSLMSYPVFIEASRKPVAQAEHTVLIMRDGCVVLT